MKSRHWSSWLVTANHQNGGRRMKADEYKLIEMCIENGLRAGYHRAHKHNDNPKPEDIWDQQLQYIMLEVCEWFKFAETADE